MIDKVSGQAIYALMSFGGFLGIGENYHPLAWSTLRYDEGKGGYVVNLDKQMLEDAPTYDMESDFQWTPDYGRQVDKYYNAPDLLVSRTTIGGWGPVAMAGPSLQDFFFLAALFFGTFLLMPGLGLGLIFFQLEQAQFELAQQRAALRGRAEPVVPQLGDRPLELLDVQRLVAQRNPVRLALGQQQRFQRLHVVRQVMFASGTHPAISRGSAAERNLYSSTESPCRINPPPADASCAAAGDRGRDGHCWPPPAQIRTSGIPAYGSYLGCLTRKRCSGHGCRTVGNGRNFFAITFMRRHVNRRFWLRRRRFRYQRTLT